MKQSRVTISIVTHPCMTACSMSAKNASRIACEEEEGQIPPSKHTNEKGQNFQLGAFIYDKM
jgi:hypothetical protein